MTRVSSPSFVRNQTPALDDPARTGGVRTALERTQRIDFAAKEAYEPIDPGNARLRVLAEETVGRGWWKLLWVPPSLPYITPGGPYAEDFARRMTKRLIFSSWTATPSSVASLLSYEADRLGAGQEFVGTTSEERDRLGRTRRSRLAYRLDREGERERPSSMSTLAIFWPMPGLSALGDPRNPDLHRGGASGELDPADLHAHVAEQLLIEHLPEPPGAPAAESGESAGSAASHWYEALRRPDASPDGLTLEQVQAAVSRAEETDAPYQEPESGSLARDRGELQARHIDQALRIRGVAQDRRVTEATVDTMAQVAAHSPGNVAYRALRRITAEAEGVSEIGLWSAAARVGSALRTLFSRPETVLLLDQLIPDEMPYWRKVLRYCAWGNLQAVLDEYVHHLHVGLGDAALDDDRLMGLAGSVAAALELRPASYEVFDPDDPSVRPKFLARFALRFGGRRENEESNRQPLVRQAFNSPFWPFVLATTSVGQEGVDFHWWCHAVMHWNLPANPVDFEQREGRVDRYDGHAVRQNIAARHGGQILASAEADPWRMAYALARDEEDRLGEFAPHWVYPGEARIERHVAPYPLSIDGARLEEIKRDVALYRLAFGQPRQEDMLQLLRMRFSEATEEELGALRLDLSAPVSERTRWGS